MAKAKREQMNVRVRELREDVAAAMRAAGCRPGMGRCYELAARCVAFGDDPSLRYVEGRRQSIGGPFLPHAWVQTSDGVHHDVTWRDGGEFAPELVLGGQEVAARMLSTSAFGPWADVPHLHLAK